MDHSKHGGMEMDMGECSMATSWNSDTSGMCIVFKSLKVNGVPSLIFYMLVLFLLSVAYERMRQVIAQREAQLRSKHLLDIDIRTGKRRPSNTAPPTCECSTNERGNLLKCQCSARSARIQLNTDGCSVEIPMMEQVERSAWYTAQIAVSFFIMLVIMTYNTYLIGAILGGAFAGHFVFHRNLQVSSTDSSPEELRGLACH